MRSMKDFLFGFNVGCQENNKRNNGGSKNGGVRKAKSITSNNA